MTLLSDLLASVKTALLLRAAPSLAGLTAAGLAPQAAFLGQHTNPRRNKERREKRLVGARQYRKIVKASRIIAKAA